MRLSLPAHDFQIVQGDPTDPKMVHFLKHLTQGLWIGHVKLDNGKLVDDINRVPIDETSLKKCGVINVAPEHETAEEMSTLQLFDELFHKAGVIRAGDWFIWLKATRDGMEKLRDPNASDHVLRAMKEHRDHDFHSDTFARKAVARMTVTAGASRKEMLFKFGDFIVGLLVGDGTVIVMMKVVAGHSPIMIDGEEHYIEHAIYNAGNTITPVVDIHFTNGNESEIRNTLTNIFSNPESKKRSGKPLDLSGLKILKKGQEEFESAMEKYHGKKWSKEEDDKRWNKKLSELKNFVQEKDHLPTQKEDGSLHRWTRRQQRSELEVYRQEQLDSVPGYKEYDLELSD
mmetsp:Transcript_45141/g.109231  ORF Transcript_45141/g.109231 Transcript_45141/m.109231 type:complete len:343 (+) Transcript_45141:386-1414(+)